MPDALSEGTFSAKNILERSKGYGDDQLNITTSLKERQCCPNQDLHTL